MLYYHGTDDTDLTLNEKNPSSDCFDICLTDDESIAWMYAERFGAGVVFEFDVPRDLKIATTQEALEILGYDEFDQMEMLCDPSALFHAFDQAGGAIKAAGFDAVEYLDQLPGDPRQFETLRVYSVDRLDLTDTYTK